MAGRTPGGRANARAHRPPAGGAGGGREAAGVGVADCRGAGQPAAVALSTTPPRPRCRPGAAPGPERRASLPTAQPRSCLGRLRLGEVVVLEPAVDIVDGLG